jgi:hypothetical protein
MLSNPKFRNQADNVLEDSKKRTQHVCLSMPTIPLVPSINPMKPEDVLDYLELIRYNELSTATIVCTQLLQNLETIDSRPWSEAQRLIIPYHSSKSISLAVWTRSSGKVILQNGIQDPSLEVGHPLKIWLSRVGIKNPQFEIISMPKWNKFMPELSGLSVLVGARLATRGGILPPEDRYCLERFRGLIREELASHRLLDRFWDVATDLTQARKTVVALAEVCPRGIASPTALPIDKRLKDSVYFDLYLQSELSSTVETPNYLELPSFFPQDSDDIDIERPEISGGEQIETEDISDGRTQQRHCDSDTVEGDVHRQDVPMADAEEGYATSAIPSPHLQEAVCHTDTNNSCQRRAETLESESNPIFRAHDPGADGLDHPESTSQQLDTGINSSIRSATASEPQEDSAMQVDSVPEGSVEGTTRVSPIQAVAMSSSIQQVSEQGRIFQPSGSHDPDSCEGIAAEDTTTYNLLSDQPNTTPPPACAENPPAESNCPQTPTQDQSLFIPEATTAPEAVVSREVPHRACKDGTESQAPKTTAPKGVRRKRHKPDPRLIGDLLVMTTTLRDAIVLTRYAGEDPKYDDFTVLLKLSGMVSEFNTFGMGRAGDARALFRSRYARLLIAKRLANFRKMGTQRRRGPERLKFIMTDSVWDKHKRHLKKAQVWKTLCDIFELELRSNAFVAICAVTCDDGS